MLTVVSDLPEGRDLGLVVVGLSTSPCSCFITSYVLGSSKSPFISHFHLEVSESSFCPGLHNLGPPSRLQSEIDVWLEVSVIGNVFSWAPEPWAPLSGLRMPWLYLPSCHLPFWYAGSFLITSLIMRPKPHLSVYICVCVCVCVHKCTHREHSISSDARLSHSYFLGKGETTFWNRILSRLVPSCLILELTLGNMHQGYIMGWLRLLSSFLPLAVLGSVLSFFFLGPIITCIN